MNKNSIIYTVCFTFIIAFFFVFFLSLANDATKEKVHINQIAAVQSSILKSINRLPAEGESIVDEYEKLFSEIPVPGDLIQTDINGSNVLIKYFTGNGLWGTITGILAVNDDISTIIGLDIISHNETPGLGGRIDEEGFKEQFREKTLSTDYLEIDGITGASLTSQSMETIINNELENIKTERSSQ